MKCPKCEHELEVVSFNDIEVDRCTNCMGIWFDHHEQDALKQLQGAENIDIGDEFVGAKFDSIRNIDCPRCQVPMHKVVHEAELEIRFERCTECKGSFFDAGEFSDYLADEIFDDFQQVMNELDSFESGQNLVDN
jgi:Zn-finger nucleic acid-binding protein